MHIAVLRNPKSSRNRAAKVKPYPNGIEPFDLTEISDLPNLLTDLKRDGIDCLVIDGGDGTVREIITCLPEIFKTNLPVIGVLSHGNTNLIAQNVGALKNPQSISRLMKLSKDESLAIGRETPVLRLDFPGKEHRPYRGFMMGWGAYTSATELARSETTSKGARQVLRIFATMLKRVFFQGRTGDLRQGVSVHLVSDNQPLAQGNRFIGLATTLRGPLTAGLNPFWGQGAGAIRWTDVMSPAPYLLPAALIAVAGKHMGWMTKNGYHSSRASKLDLTIDTPLVLDGELLKVDQPQRITISAEEHVCFISI